MDIKESLKVYQNNMSKITHLDALITNTDNKEFWKNSMVNRAKELNKIYKENNEILDIIKHFDLEKYEDIDGLYSTIREMYNFDFDDSEVLIPLLLKYKNYYEKKEIDNNTINNLLFIYSAIIYESTEYVARVTGEENIVSEYHMKIYDLEQYIDNVSDLFSLRLFIVNYYNHLNSISDKKQYYVESYELYKKFIDLVYNKNAFAKVINDESISSLIRTTEMTWLIIDDVIEEAPEYIKKNFYDISEKYYKLELSKNDGVLKKIDSQVYFSYLHAKAMFGDISYDSAIDRFLEYYLEKREDIILDENVCDDDFYFLVNGPISLEKLLLHIDCKKRLDIMDMLNSIVDNTWEKILKAKKETPFVNSILALWCCSTLKYCSNLEEKERKILDLIVKRQFTTYLHSYMVKLISIAIFETVYKNNRQLFSNLFMPYDEIYCYIERAALLHDIGKSKICDIVTMVRRRLSDYEFTGIKNHPKYGVSLINGDDDLSIFIDVIYGHHKWYNGNGGYPLDFDNTKSKYRIIIDIITLADCLDAATDYLGRNYKNSKSVKEVLSEFIKDKGIKYNPEIVDIIVNDDELIEKLDRLTSSERLDAMYMACENKK